MKKNSIYVYIAASLAMIIPAPGRFACGIILVFELNFLMLLGTIVRFFIRRLNIDQMKYVLLISILVFLTMFMRQILVFCMPETALQLGFVMYLPTVSSFLIGYMFDDNEYMLKDELAVNMKHSLSYSLFALIFFLFRDIAGFGTIMFIAPSGICEKVLFNSDRITALSFLATIPGALVFAAVILIVYVFLMNKFRILEKAGLEK